MPINFYDQPAQSNIINTYVQAPFQEILQAGLARQGRYDETLSALNSNQEYLDQLQAIEGIQLDTLNKARTDLSGIASSYSNKDLSNAYIRRQLRDEIRRKINPTTINTIIQSKKNYDEAQRMKAELDARGLFYDPYDEAMDPARNKTLRANQLYDYMPRAFQDPEKVAGAYFDAIQPDTQIMSNEATGMITERTSRSLNKLRGAIESDWRTFADTPQGQWVIDQHRRRNPEDKTSEADIVKGYMNDVAKRYAYTKDNYAGAIPGWTKKQTGPTFPMNPVAVPGVAIRKPEEEIKYRKNKQAVAGLSFQLAQEKSNLRMAKTDEAKQATQNKISDIENKISKLHKVETEALEAAGLSNQISQEDVFNIGNKLVDKFNLDFNEARIALEAAEYLYKTTKTKQGYDRTMDYLNENYSSLSDLSKRKIATATFGGGDLNNTAYSEINKLYPTRKEKKQAFKGLDDAEAHPGYVAPVTRVQGEIDYLFNPKSGDYDLPANTSTVLKGVQNNPASFALSLYNTKKQKWETINDKDDLKEFNGGKFLKYEILPTLPNEKGSQQLEFRLTDEDNKVSDKLYRIDLNDPTQVTAIADDYMRSATSPLDPNFMIGFRLHYPEISSSYMTQKSGDEKIIPIQTQEGSAEVSVSLNSDGTQTIYDGYGKPYTDSRGNSKFETDEEIVNALYELQIRVSGLVQ